MKDLAVILFAKTHANEDKNSFFKDIFLKVTNIFKKKEINIDFEVASIYSGLNVYFIKLPYSKANIENMMPQKLNKLLEGVKSFLDRKSIIYCVYPAGVHLNFGDRFIESNFFGGHLFKGLFRRVIKSIYNENNIDPDDLNIAIISGEEEEETNGLLNVLAPEVKYLTIIDKQKDRYNDLMDRVYEKTGLSIVLTEDLRTALKTSDILINLSQSIKPASRTRLKPGMLLVNYGKIDGLEISDDNVVINGIEITYKEFIPEKIKMEFFNFYNKLEFLEMIILFSITLDGPKSFDFSDEYVRRVEEEFDKLGGCIKSFKGMHSFLKRKDVLEKVKQRAVRKVPRH